MKKFTVAPLVGFSPISHMGHVHDFSEITPKSTFTYIGVSPKPTVFTIHERLEIFERQSLSYRWMSNDLIAFSSNSMGESIARAAISFDRKDLVLIFGKDRQRDAEKLVKAINENRIKELKEMPLNSVTIEYTPSLGREMGFSGTNMRKAAAEGDFATFWHHLGHCFDLQEAREIMSRVKSAIDKGDLSIKRPK